MFQPPEEILKEVVRTFLYQVGVCAYWGGGGGEVVCSVHNRVPDVGGGVGEGGLL